MVDVAERSTRRGIQEMVLHVAGRLCLLAQLHPSEAERHDLHHLVSMLMKAFKDVGTDELVDPGMLDRLAALRSASKEAIDQAPQWHEHVLKYLVSVPDEEVPSSTSESTLTPNNMN